MVTGLLAIDGLREIRDDAGQWLFSAKQFGCLAAATLQAEGRKFEVVKREAVELIRILADLCPDVVKPTFLFWREFAAH